MITALNSSGISENVLSNDQRLQVVAPSSKYYEAVNAGRVFSMTLTAWTTTTSAGNLLAAAAAATTNFALWNPAGSGKNLSLLKFGVFMISGTQGIPGLFHSYAETCPTLAASVLLTPIRNNKFAAASDNVAMGASSAAGTALTGGSALLVVRVADLAISAGSFSNLAGTHATEYIDGDLVIPPGKMWVPTWAAAGATTLGGYSITWEEIDE